MLYNERRAAVMSAIDEAVDKVLALSNIEPDENGALALHPVDTLNLLRLAAEQLERAQAVVGASCVSVGRGLYE